MRQDVTFPSGGEDLAAWWFPCDADRAPCVILAHGFTGTRGARLDAYAERFAAAGLHALVFDYRHFGASGGEPRDLLSVRRQLQDWRAAVAYARSRPEVDPDRVAVWGSSFSGGHVVVLAAEDDRIAAVVSQAPFMDGVPTLLAVPPKNALRLTVAGLRDVAAAVRGRPPHYVPATGRPGELAVMTSPDADPGFRAIADDAWTNRAAARIALRIGSYRPVAKARKVSCPWLVQVADDDVVTPPKPAYVAAARGRRAELRHYAGGHFDVYVPPLFDTVVADQVAFLRRHLLEPAA